MNQFKDSPETTILPVRGLNKSATSFDVELHEILDPGTVYLSRFMKFAGTVNSCGGVCADDIASRHNAQSVSVYAVRKKDRGYVVSASASLARGNRVKFYCLTNQYGGVEDISIEGR